MFYETLKLNEVFTPLLATLYPSQCIPDIVKTSCINQLVIFLIANKREQDLIADKSRYYNPKGSLIPDSYSLLPYFWRIFSVYLSLVNVY